MDENELHDSRSVCEELLLANDDRAPGYAGGGRAVALGLSLTVILVGLLAPGLCTSGAVDEEVMDVVVVL